MRHLAERPFPHSSKSFSPPSRRRQFYGWGWVGVAGAPLAPEVALVGQASLCCSSSFLCGVGAAFPAAQIAFVCQARAAWSHTLSSNIVTLAKHCRTRQCHTHTHAAFPHRYCHAQHCYTQSSQNVLWWPHPVTPGAFWKKLTGRAIRPSN